MIWSVIWEAKGGKDIEFPIARMDRDTEHTAPTERDRNAHRIVACVNACVGMADPAAEIATLREALAELVNAHDCDMERGAVKLGIERARAALKGAQ